MTVKFGSARRDEYGRYTNGKPGDQTGREVAEQGFYLHSKGWYGYAPKSDADARNLAQEMRGACNNNNIGYSQSERLQVWNAAKKTGSLKTVSTKVNSDCSSLVRTAIYCAMGVDVGNRTTANIGAAMARTGRFKDRVEVKTAADCTLGMVLVTKRKGHVVIVTEGPSAGAAGTQTVKPSPKTTRAPQTASTGYVKGRKYTLLVELNVRTGAGVSYRRKGHNELTVDGRRHDRDNDGALDKGTVVTALEIKTVGADVWIRCPSGWVAARYNGKTYIR